MLEYLPWSNKTLEDTISHYKKGKFSILDIELGGQCNLSCIYCDSPDRKKKSKINIKNIESIIHNNPIEWIFVCGLGEPTYDENNIFLTKLLKICNDHNIKCSIFTNLLNFDEEIIEYIKNGILNILFKLDSFNLKTVNKIYSTNRGDQLLKNIKKLPPIVSKNNSCTNIAASIVPTAINDKEIVDIVKYCFDNDMYPLLGILEKAGSAISKFDQLFLSKQRLLEIREVISEMAGSTYRIPVCPAVIGGIHLSHESKIIVDKITGLSCHWFWTKTPEVHEITEFNENSKWEDIELQMFEYRNSKINTLTELLNKDDEMPIGGCGGNVKMLLNKYHKIQTSLQ